jgi:prepilin-type N-terminal cleavage/methylation domain-containing protein
MVDGTAPETGFAGNVAAGIQGPRPPAGFTLIDLLVALAVVSVLAAVILPLLAQARAGSRRALCLGNVRQVNGAVLQFANDHAHTLPQMDDSPPPGGWWWYKEQVKGYADLSGTSSPSDTVFACPDDRGYGEGTDKPQPFCRSKKHDYTSYVFNGVNLPGMPNVAGREVAAIKEPSLTLLVMEWTAHAPLSWHRSRTGRANTPFYTDAESVVGFVDGRADCIKIHYDGLNAAYTRDPAPGYGYKYSGD